MNELARLDATAQVELVRRRELSPLELVDAAIDRIERVNPQVNAVVATMFDRAWTVARNTSPDEGLLPGVPIVVKDTVPTQGDPWHRGMRLLADLDHRAGNDAHVVGRMRSQGVAVVGKANVPELEGGITTEPLVHGPTRNPWSLDRTVGGSSGGSAAAVAAGLVPLAIGVDGGGSIRIPASVCGVVGLKPSRGRTSLFPMYTEEGLSTAGPIARTVRDCALALDAMAGSPPGDHYLAPALSRALAGDVGNDPGRLRIGVWTPRPDGIIAEPECLNAVAFAAELLEQGKHIVHASHPDELDGNFFRRPEFVITGACYIAFQIEQLERELDRGITQADVESVTWAATAFGQTVSAAQLQGAYAYNRQAAVRYASWFDDSGSDLLLTPTLAVPPFLLGSLAPASEDAPWPDVASWVPFTPHANLAGLPAITLPLYWSADGLPIGVQLVARYGREDVLIRVAAQLEAASPWAHRYPGVFAS
jgi:amidase